MERLTSDRPWEEAKEDLVSEPGYSFIWQRLNAIEKVLGKDYDLDRLKEIVEKSTRPAADVVEVVRCKDCKWFVYDMDLNHETYPNEIEADGICQITEKYCDMPHFCSYGERKENAT